MKLESDGLRRSICDRSVARLEMRWSFEVRFSGDQADTLVLFSAKSRESYLRRPRNVSEAGGGSRHGY
jgi:hypothetical protein